MSSNAEPSSTWIDLTFACTKLGLCKLNGAINVTLRAIASDDTINVSKNTHSIHFEIPNNFTTKDAGVLYNCMCVRVTIRTTNLASRSKVLNLFLEYSKCFV